MQIESIGLKNFKSFREMELRGIPPLCVVVGANGSGKSTLLSVFEFLREAFTGNVCTALAKAGGSRGFREVRTRNAQGNIEFELKFREQRGKPLISYALAIGEQAGRPIVAREILKCQHSSHGKPWCLLDFSHGEGEVASNELDLMTDGARPKRAQHKLKSAEVLAVKGLAQFERFPTALTLGRLIEGWHIPDCHLNHVAPVTTGSVKLSTYRALLSASRPHSLLAIKNPEHHLSPTLLAELAAEFRACAERGSQVFVSTHSPDFLNAAAIDEVHWLVKKHGQTEIKRARDDKQLAAFIAAGSQPGQLWREGWFTGASP